MPESKMKVTLIGTLLAVPGLEFVYRGALPECEGCKKYRVCNNLQQDRRYRIIGVRSRTVHECRVHEGGAYAVEVIESPVIALIPSEKVIVNSTIAFDPTCTITGCKSYELCHPEGLIKGERYVVGEVLGSAPEACERGRNLKLVELRPV
jgi:uncharacterized protein (UPF0179 family)